MEVTCPEVRSSNTQAYFLQPSAIPMPESKRRRFRLTHTNEVKRQLPHMSANAFAQVVEFAKENDLSQVSSRRSDLPAGRDLSLEATPFGETLVEVELFGTPPYANLKVHMVHPLSYTWLAYKKGGGFYSALNKALLENPCTLEKPWRLVLYSDEVVPGNQLTVQNTRKVWVIYWSFLEFHYNLSDEDAWCPIVAEKSIALKHVSAGISQVFCQAIKLFFGVGREVPHDFRAGIRLDGPSGCSLRLFAILSMVLQDGGAQKLVWSCKGDGGTRPCMLCKNLVAPISDVADGSDLIDDFAADKVLLATSAEIKGTIQRLKTHKSVDSKGDFKLREQASGFNLQEHSLLCDETLDELVHPADQYCHDYMHGLFQTGVFNFIVFQVLKHLASLKPKVWRVLNEYLQNWNWPRAKNVNPTRADWFGETRVNSYKKAGHIKCSASDAISMLPVLCFFVTNIGHRIQGVNLVICSALHLFADLVDLLMAAMHGLVTPEQLDACIKKLLEVCKLVGWGGDLQPKFHWCLHFPHHLRRWNVLPTCWTHERKHKIAKRYGTDNTNKSFAKSLISEIASHQLLSVYKQDSLNLSPRLLDPKKSKKALVDLLKSELSLEHDPEVFQSITAKTHFCSQVAKGDIIMCRFHGGYIVGRLWLCVSMDSELLCFVTVYTPTSEDPAQRCALWKMSDDSPLLCELSDVLAPVIWTECSEGVVRVLLPYEFASLAATSP